MSLTTDLDSVIIEAIDDCGETVTIYGDGPTQTWTDDALVTGGQGSFDGVTGGYYDKNSYTISVPKSTITFAPKPGMLVDARGKELRIPDDGVTDLRAHYRIQVVSRDAPK